MSSLICKLESELEASSGSSLAVVINGKFLLHNGKMVYAKMQRSFTLFVQNKNNLNTAEEEVINNSFLISRLLSSRLNDVDIGVDCSSDSVYFKVLTSMSLLIFESVAYHLAHQIVDAEDSGKSVNAAHIEGVALDTTLVQALSIEFRNEAYRTYGDLVYAAGSNRFTNKLMKTNDFYKIQKSFIPVFIDFTEVYNPFRSKNARVDITGMYQVAIEKNRKVVYDKYLSCYLLTHEEICRAFGMSRFMRFTSSYWYMIYVGLLRTNLAGFPRKASQNDRLNNRVFVLSRNEAQFAGLKSKYTPAEYISLMKSLETELQKESANLASDPSHDDSRVKELSSKLDTLHMYTEFDTLYYSCVANLSRLTSIGPYQLDEKKITPADLYNIVSEARLEVVSGA